MIPFGNKVRIQVPVELQRRATKLLNSHKYKNQKSKINEDQPLLIKCPYHPHRLNQTYPTNKIPLSSLNWNGQRSKGRTFSFLPVVGSKPHPKDNDFSCLGLHDSLPSLLKAHNFKAPTNIQALAIPQILGAESDILIASETGNGKTLSFLLPLLHGLLKSPTPDNLPPLNSPRAIIAVPSRELAQQIYKLSLSLTQDLGLSSHLLMGGSTKNKAVYGPREHMDVLVCSLGALHKYLSNGYLKSSQARYLVFDEADSLLDDTFSRISSNIIASVQKSRRGEPCQLIFSGATMPRTLNDALGSVLDVEGIIHIKSNSLHRVPVHIKQKFVRTSKAGRLPILLREIEKDILNKRKVLIFVNKASTSIWLERTLNKENVKAQCFSQIISYKYRHEQINKFLDPSGDTHVLVATDLASRGLDFDASLAHVVNYDFPHNMSDYIHRIGRVGRIGSINAQARVLNLISNPWNVELTQKIERTLRLNTVLPNVNSNIVRIIEKRRREASIGLTEEDGVME